MTQEDLEERSRFSQSYISQVELGKVRRPSRDRLQRFADALSRPDDAFPVELLLAAADYATPELTQIPSDWLARQLNDPGRIR